MSDPLLHSMFHGVLFPVQTRSEDNTTLSLRQSIRFLPEPRAIMAHLPLVVFDFETTGLVSASDRIIEVGAQRIEGGKVVGEFETLVHTQFRLSQDIQRLTGITQDMLADKPTIQETLPKFLQFIQGAILVAHNADFDMGFLGAECSRQGIDLHWPAFCTLKMARDLLPDLERKNLDTLAEHFGLTFESRHRSVGDVKVTVGVLEAMLEEEGHRLKSWSDFQPYSSSLEA